MKRLERDIERRFEGADAKLVDLIAVAVGRALDKRWRRTLATAATVSLVVTLAVTFPLASWLNGTEAATASNAAKQNCDTQASTRPQGNVRAFVTREILTVAQAAYDQFPKRFRHAEDLKVAADALTELPYAPGQGVAHVHSFGDLSGLISDLPLLHCAKTIK